MKFIEVWEVRQPVMEHSEGPNGASFVFNTDDLVALRKDELNNNTWVILRTGERVLVKESIKTIRARIEVD